MALKFISYRARSEAEVKSHLLLRGYATADVETAVTHLRIQNFLDDETFAQNWALYRANRGYGPKRIEQELKVRGIVQPLIREAIRKTFNPGDEEQKAQLLLEKKFKPHQLSDPKVLRRAVAFLQRRGFSDRVVHRLLRNGVQEE